MFRKVHVDEGGIYIRVNRNHEQKKEKVKKNYCDVCKKEFKNENGLRLHNMKVHS